MPSGARKRKAAKKKLQKEAHKNGSHPKENEDPKSHDERESDGGEVDSESFEEGAVSSHVEGTKEIDFREENAGRKVKAEGNFMDVTVDADDFGVESHNGGATEEHKSSSSSSLEDEEVTVVAEIGEVEQQRQSSVQDVVASEEMLKAADYLLEVASNENKVTSEVYFKSIEESISIEGSVKQVVSLPEESNIVSESVLVENSVIDSGFKQNVDETMQPVHENGKVSPAVTDLPEEKIEEKAIADGSPVKSSKPGGIPMQEDEGFLHQSSGVTTVGKSRGDGYVKEAEKHKILEEQHLVSSAPLPVQRTSWMNCCGLFEVLTGASST